MTISITPEELQAYTLSVDNFYRKEVNKLVAAITQYINQSHMQVFSAEMNTLMTEYRNNVKSPPRLIALSPILS